MDRKKHEIWAVVLLMFSLLILFSVVSFHAADPTFFGPELPRKAPRNWVGSFGSNLAYVLLSVVGLGAYALSLIGIYISFSLFRGVPPLSHYPSQVPGILLLCITSVTLLATHRPFMQLFGQQIPTGGFIGRQFSTFLHDRLSSTGAHIVLIGTFVIAYLLATPYSLKTMTDDLLKALMEGLKRIKTHWFEARRKPPAALKQANNHPSVFKASPQPVPSLSAPEQPAPAEPVRRKPRKEVLPEDSTAVGNLRYTLPALTLLETCEHADHRPDWKALEESARVLEDKLADFGVQGKVVGILPGPVITMFEYAPAPGIKISRIVSLSDDLSMALKAISIRVVAPIPGKAAIGIEIPNQHRETVSIRAVLESEAFASSSPPLTIVLGKDITGQTVVANLARMPHLLIAGATGTGKSVCLNTLLTSLLFRNTPDQLRLLLIDPKRIELKSYENIPHLIHPVVNDAKMATRALRWAVQEMELRYRLLAAKNVRNIESYNRALAKEKAKEEKAGEAEAEAQDPPVRHQHLPYMVIVIDELADLMMIASREVEESITRLAQMARAAGIHLILATQRPSVDVLTGIIKANIPTRISFQVSSRIDSRTILDSSGAESLLGSGDMLFLPPGTAKLQRIHGAYISEAELQRVTDFWRDQPLVDDTLSERVDFREHGNSDEMNEEELDDRYEEAVDLVLETRQASISMLQRRLRVGYNRAARMIEMMEQRGLVGPSDGIKPREVIGTKP